MPLKIIYEGATIVVLDKPAGISVSQEERTQEPTIASLLCQQIPDQKTLGPALRYGIVHRLDKDTSGVLLVAKNEELYHYLQEQFQSRLVEKRYYALVAGRIKEQKGVIDTLLARSPNDRRKQRTYPLSDTPQQGKRRATTHYTVKDRFQNYTFLELRPKTGRKHQIRAHLASIGHPIAGDNLYGFKNQQTPQDLSRQFLHAETLTIQMPDGTKHEFQSDLPEDLQRVLEQLSPIKE